MPRHLLPLILVSGSLLTGCSEPAMTATSAPSAAKAPLSLRQDWQAIVKDAAAKYKSWARVSDRANWAPTDCRIPPAAGVSLSDSSDADTHGGKLYFLYAAMDKEYPRPSPGRAVADQPLGQVVVKESFAAQLCTDADAKAAEERAKSLPADSFGRHKNLPDEYAQRWDGQTHRTYKAGPAAGLFMMFKAEPTPDTDQGWVYATMTPAGEISSLGRVESCMGCHAHAKFDRLFGPLYARTPDTR